MVVSGYVALKLQNSKLLHYADWTNTRRKYHLARLPSHTISDLRRIFNGRTTVLLVNQHKLLDILQNILGPLNTAKCIEVENTGSASKILTDFMTEHKKKKSYYNYQRDHWLSIISVINIYLMLNSEVPKSKILKIVECELAKYNRDMTSQLLLQTFISMELYDVKSVYIPHAEGLYKEDIISFPANRMALTLG